jgi:hypothetical protein
METYLAELLEWYCGEIGGEAFFSALARGAGEREHAAKWEKLAQLENLVGHRLLTELAARKVPIPSSEADLQRGLHSAQSYAGLTWRQMLDKLRPELVGYVRSFEDAESRMPEELVALARFVTDHERALLEFVTRELDQNGLRSLDYVLAMLGETQGGRADGVRAHD